MTQCTGSWPDAKERYLQPQRREHPARAAQRVGTRHQNSYALSSLKLVARYMGTRYFLPTVKKWWCC